MNVAVGLSLMLADDFRRASLPLFEEGLVDALEWNVDAGWGRDVPGWATDLVELFADEGRLYGHGVELSMLSVEWTPRHEAWVAELTRECERRRYVHLTEHFGFMTAPGFSGGTPLPLPYSPAAVRLGAARLADLARRTGRPIGLENLAFAFGARDVDDQPRFIAEILEASGGFLLLDLHNLFCQADNFGRDPLDLLDRYPLDRVREIHMAGGRVVATASGSDERGFRRDSHDAAMPAPVLDLLASALERTPNLEVVIFERSDYSLYATEEIDRFHDDYRAVKSAVEARGGG